jgi:hypothetical protein
MEFDKLIDNVNHLLGNELKQHLKHGSKLQVAASCFSMYAFVTLKNELSKIDYLEFIFTEPKSTAVKPLIGANTVSCCALSWVVINCCILALEVFDLNVTLLRIHSAHSEFIFTEPTFTPESATDKFKKERREFHIPKTHRERSLYGSDFEIQLKNATCNLLPCFRCCLSSLPKR